MPSFNAIKWSLSKNNIQRICEIGKSECGELKGIVGHSRLTDSKCCSIYSNIKISRNFPSFLHRSYRFLSASLVNEEDLGLLQPCHDSEHAILGKVLLRKKNNKKPAIELVFACQLNCSNTQSLPHNIMSITECITIEVTFILRMFQQLVV